MDQRNAQRLARVVLQCEPGWQPEPTYDARTDSWEVKAWPAGRSEPAETYRGHFAFHFARAKMNRALRHMKALRLRRA